MANSSRREFLTAIPAGLAAARQVRAQTTAGHDLKLWYTQPAAQWTEALPLGNGRLGAMVFGGIAAERIQLNEDTLWSGHPRDWNNPDAVKYLPVVRRLVLEEEKYVEAGPVCQKMQGPFNESYLPLGNLRLKLEAAGSASGYRRELDLDTAIASVFYRSDGAGFQREVFVSAPDQVVVVRLTTTRPEGLSFEVSLDSPVHSSVDIAGKDGLILRGKAPAHTTPDYHGGAVVYDEKEGLGMHFAGLLRALPEGGSVEAASGALNVRGARAVTLLLTAATGYRGFDRDPDLPAGALAEACRATLERAARKNYASLRQDHIQDHQRLFRRVSLDLGSGPAAQKPTDERLRSFAENAKEPDQGLAALYFQYGRYLLIASSRPGGQPANLQGLWNELVLPPWSSNWTANINVQMNYWPAETCNLTECHEPLFDLIEGLSRNGRLTAKVNYGAAGWVSHHNVDLWRQSGPVGEGSGSPTWANWPMSGPWLCAHLWEHYLFSGDAEHLKRAYPIMKGAAEFYLDWLIEDGRGHLTTCPSLSTENTFRAPDGRTAQVSAGCTMDMALIAELFENCIAAARLLSVDEDFAARLGKARGRLIPFQIGKYGQLQEWSKDFEESEPGQRHMSHMYPLFPGSQITPRKTPALAKAARVSLERRLAARAELIRDGAALGPSISGRAWRMAGEPMNRWRCCSNTAPGRTCSTRTRRASPRFSRSTETSAGPPRLPRCCCRAMPERSPFCRRSRRCGVTAAYRGSQLAAALRWISTGAPAS
jgi:alpha-L-fucosidase 2